MSAPDLASFTETTRRVLTRDGMDEYLPTLLVGKDIRVIEGIPPNVDHREAIQKHAAKLGLLKGEFFFGVRTGPDRVTTGHFKPGSVECMSVVRSAEGLSVTEGADASWWKVGL